MGLSLEQDYLDYFHSHKEEFQESLLDEAVNVRDKIEEILLVGNIDLLNNAHTLVMYALSGKEDSVEEFAKKEGISWASQDLTLSFKLEWVQAIRRTLWRYLHQFEKERHADGRTDAFFALEEQVNDQIDQFLNGFFLTYSDYKDKLIESQKKLVEELSVPLIPISQNVGVVPLIREIDITRAQTIEEKILVEIKNLRIKTLILDFSGIAIMHDDAINYMRQIIHEIKLMGCDCVITGLRPEIVLEITRLGLRFEEEAETKTSLQQALQDYLMTTESDKRPFH
ncbi:STAS domain-containing protein [Salsuginibacillus kocurii]|uniref:STAS domain-containing protein n=1 Tax=Salsuginibacillus kocurii TaxID=427078 RepID=UPI00037F92E4|nr:STAS domain-containing protein [Salsuginibacillus kocurii]